MVFFDLFRNYVNALIGRNQEFEKLLAAKDITAVKEQMTSRVDAVLLALKEYDTKSHEIMKRPDKEITDKKGKFLRYEPTWKLPIPYPVFINEIALVFLYGRPVKWTQLSEGTDEGFKAYQDFIKETRFDSKIRECKRIAGAETESAMLFRVYRDEDDNTAKCQIRVLAKSKGDEIYTRFDQYGNMLAFAWGYFVKDEGQGVTYHFDVYTKKAIYHCSKKSLGWDVVEEINFIGKIPVIYFQQEKEWDGVEILIHREESIASHTADTNDYFADPMLLMASDIIRNLPEKSEAGKTLFTNDKDGVEKAAKYLTWDNASESKQKELEWLQTQILQKSFTPNITTDSLKAISQLSAKALKTVMMLADIKAAKRKETHDELLDRAASLIKAIIGNVLDVSLKSQCDSLIVGHEFQEPFGDDIADDLDNVIKAVDAGIMSTETGIELNPLIKDPHRESERIASESEERMKQQQSIFGNGNEGGAASFDDDDDDNQK
ncbi:MAG: phage portal protein [Bacteroidales bacterium]|nr:phage portal protein [Bacteroidales bacterium]